MDLSSIVLSITGIVAIITLFQNYKQSRGKAIYDYFSETQKRRDEVANLDDKDRVKAQSLLKKTLNWYNVISYNILNNIVDERDAFNVLKRNIFDFRNKCLDAGLDLKQYEYFTKVYDRWDTWGLSHHYLVQAVKYLFLALILVIVIYINV